MNGFGYAVLMMAPVVLAAEPTAAPQAVVPVQAPLAAADLQFFESRIRPVLVDRCYKCHSHDADKIKGGLMLDTREGMLHGGDTGPAIVPGKPEDSLMVDAIRYTDDALQMPPKGDRLPDAQVADLTEWIRRGAPDPRTLVAKGSSPTYGGVGRAHWSFLPVKKPQLPAVQDSGWCLTPVDNFILAKLEENGLRPNPPADRRTLMRRVTFDLIGLPPTEGEIQDFINDTSPDAFEKVVDRLLASPHYGERWGRHWLDVARYADTKGDTPQREDPRLPFAWTYRDYVVQAFNQDKPYTDFIVEQLAADRLQLAENKKTGADPRTVDESRLAAMGFLTLGNRFENSTNDIINDRIDVTTKAFLGLTVSCARCHDHKFDPIPTKDYYALYGVFADSYEPKIEPWLRPPEDPSSPALLDYLAKLHSLADKKTALDAQVAELRRSREPKEDKGMKRRELIKQGAQLSTEYADLESSPEAPPKANVLLDVQTPKDYPVLVRGEAQNLGPVVPRHFLEILSPDQKHPIALKNGSGRLELAKAIASPTNPMTARVLVNRIWQGHFGEGFVPTPDDLGNQSAPPTHPELLDYLASDFMEQGWSIKHLQRMIVLSNAYRESSAPNPGYAETDPDNKLHWRFPVLAMDLEQMHDSILAIAGTLDLTVGGRPVSIGSEGFATRRALYTFIDRRNPAEIFTQFNFPNPSVPTGRRFQTVVPQQELFLMNSPLVIETARKLAHTSAFIDLPNDEARVESLFLSVYQRPPMPREVELCLTYLDKTPGGVSLDAPASTAQSEAAGRQAEKQADQAGRLAQRLRAKVALQAEPGAAAFRSRAPLDAWTKLAHALFQTNEAMFVN